MPRQIKCSYCRTVGHNISRCDSERGNILFNHIRSIAIDYIVLERRTIHVRAQMLYERLIDIYYADELKLILSKVQCRIHGNKKEHAARFVYSYFIKQLAYGPYSRHVEYNEYINLNIYADYWRLLSEGKQGMEVNQVLNGYLTLVNQAHLNNDVPADFRAHLFSLLFQRMMHHNNRVQSDHKFPINVVMKTCDLTEEEPTQYFECAICMEEESPILDQIGLGCGHSFCSNCITQMLTNSQTKKEHPRCGLCRADFKNVKVHTQKIMEDYNTRFCFAC